MQPYWEAFIEEYKDEIPHICLWKILQAFYSYVENDNETCRKIMNT